MHETVGEAGPPVDIPQNLGNLRPRQHPVQPEGQVACGLGNGGWDAEYEEFAVLTKLSKPFRQEELVAALLLAVRPADIDGCVVQLRAN
jgi:hypothetical protein